VKVVGLISGDLPGCHVFMTGATVRLPIAG